MAALTGKQAMFVQEYLIDLNASAACVRAGYKSKNPDVDGYNLLVNPSISVEIQKAMDERAKRTNITADKVLNEIAGIAFDDISNYLEFYTDTDTGEVRTKIKDSKTINTKNVSEVSCGKDGSFRFKLYCKDNALSMLGKHLKLFTDKTEITGANGADFVIKIKRKGDDE